MTNASANSVFESSPSPAGLVDGNDAVESASSELEFVSGALKELQERLDRANDQMVHVAAVRTTEVEIGRLFVEAQRFTDASLANLEEQVHSILKQAEEKADEIIREAHEEAEEIRRGAQASSAIPIETARCLRDAIAGFSHINGELVKELEALNAILAPTEPPGTQSATTTPTTIGLTE
jgi:cell division septum initiation protein DivIVA